MKLFTEKNVEITTSLDTSRERLFPFYIAVFGFVTTCIVVAVCLIRGTRKARFKLDHEEHNQLQVNKLAFQNLRNFFLNRFNAENQLLHVILKPYILFFNNFFPFHNAKHVSFFLEI